MFRIVVGSCLLLSAILAVVVLETESLPVDAKSSEVDMYHKHLAKMDSYRCNLPVAKIFKTEDVLNENLKFDPPCVVLHRCGADTGCCSDPAQVCGPVKEELVDLYFKIQRVVWTRHRKEQSKKNRKITFESRAFANHTECGCRDRLERNVFG